MNGNSGSAGLFFLTGLGAGIAVTVLLVPRSGASTRRLIGRKAGEGTDWIKDKAVAAREYVRSHGEELRDRVTEAAHVIGRSPDAPRKPGNQSAGMARAGSGARASRSRVGAHAARP